MTLLPREPAPAPPKGFRKPMSKQVKLDACLIALGIDPATAQFDHQPSIQERVYLPEIGDVEPPCNDPRYIVPSGKRMHATKTAKRDIPEIAKTRRLSKDQEAFRRAMSMKCHDGETLGEKVERKRAWPKQRLRSRPFRRARPPQEQ